MNYQLQASCHKRCACNHPGIGHAPCRRSSFHLSSSRYAGGYSWNIVMAILSVFIVNFVTSTPPPTPVIGILSVPQDKYPDYPNYSYIAASYVKWLEASGARSIPIPIDAPKEDIEDLFYQVNGILFPGGDSDLPESAITIWNLVLESNRKGRFFPLWGTCLGYEYLLQLGSNNPSILESGYRTDNVSLPLYNVSKYVLYANDDDLYESITTMNLTMNAHTLGISTQRFLDTKELTNFWKITSINYNLVSDEEDADKDDDPKDFVSTIEPNDPEHFPVYGVQYHPEKSAFEYGSIPHTNIPYSNINHSREAISMSLKLANFFVDLARKNQEQQQGIEGPDRHEYTKSDQYPWVYSYDMIRSHYMEQKYLIPPATGRGGRKRKRKRTCHPGADCTELIDDGGSEVTTVSESTTEESSPGTIPWLGVTLAMGGTAALLVMGWKGAPSSDRRYSDTWTTERQRLLLSKDFEKSVDSKGNYPSPTTTASTRSSMTSLV